MIEHGPTRIANLTLENYRLFDSLHVELHPELTVFVASNGGGKTAILDAIAAILRPFVDILDGYGRTKRAPITDIRRVLDPSDRMQLVLPMQLLAHLRLDGVPHKSVVGLRDEKGRSPKRSSSLDDQARNLRQAIVDRAQDHSLPPVDLPLIAYYGTGRLWNHPEKLSIRKKNAELDPTPNSPLRGYTDALEAASHYRQFADAFRRISGEASWPRHLEPELRKRAPILQLVTIDSAIQTVIGAKTEWQRLSWDWDENKLVAIDKNRSRLPVDFLSDGIRTMIGLVGDLAYRASLLNPHFVGEPLSRVRGIVLIDEVDMHLHPEWQQVVLGSLRDAFPNVQFIVTTHSPQVLSTVPRECIRILEPNQEGGWHVRTPEEQTEGVGSALVMANVMGVDPTPDNEHVHRLRDYHSLIVAGYADREDARTLRGLLDAHFGPQSAVMLECDRVIRLEEMKRRMLRREGA